MGNIVIRRAGSGGGEAAPPVIIQGGCLHEAFAKGYSRALARVLLTGLNWPANPSNRRAGHVDMVCEKNADVVHDFMQDPIRLVGAARAASVLALGSGVGCASQPLVEAAFARYAQPAVTAARASSCYVSEMQVRDGDWVTADGTTLGSDNGERGGATASARSPRSSTAIMLANAHCRHWSVCCPGLARPAPVGAAAAA